MHQRAHCTFDLPVQRDVVPDVVGHPNDKAVAFPRDDLGAGALPVHRDDALARAQPCHIRHCHLQNKFITRSHRTV
jgi:hypothetical protein